MAQYLLSLQAIGVYNRNVKIERKLNIHSAVELIINAAAAALRKSQRTNRFPPSLASRSDLGRL
jgi:hypothetical protein